MKTAHLQHKHGGRITAIHSVAHAVDRGVAYWFYKGDVEWNDGGKSVNLEIAPWALCYDQKNLSAEKEYATVADTMQKHLIENGEWHDQKRAKDGRVYSWSPKKKADMEIALAA